MKAMKKKDLIKLQGSLHPLLVWGVWDGSAEGTVSYSGLHRTALCQGSHTSMFKQSVT